MEKLEPSKVLQGLQKISAPAGRRAETLSHDEFIDWIDSLFNRFEVIVRDKVSDLERDILTREVLSVYGYFTPAEVKIAEYNVFQGLAVVRGRLVPADLRPPPYVIRKYTALDKDLGSLVDSEVQKKIRTAIEAAVLAEREIWRKEIADLRAKADDRRTYEREKAYLRGALLRLTEEREAQNIRWKKIRKREKEIERRDARFSSAVMDRAKMLVDQVMKEQQRTEA